MERRVLSLYITVLLLMICIIASLFDVKVKDNVNKIKFSSNLELEKLAINSVNEELKDKYLKISNNIPAINLTEITTNTSKNIKTNKDKKIITEKKVTTKKLYGTLKKTITTIKYEVTDDNKKQINKNVTTKYEVSKELLKRANKWYEKDASYMEESLKYINDYRKEANRKKVKLDKNLCIAAYIRAYEISESNKFSHTRPGNRRSFTVLNDLKISYYYVGENLAMGSYDSPENVVNAWAYSKDHYKNMIIPQYKKVGLAYIKVEDTYYWAQIFTS